MLPAGISRPWTVRAGGMVHLAGTGSGRLPPHQLLGRCQLRPEIRRVCRSTQPVADFTASPTSGFAPLTVVFTNTSTGYYTSSLWNFGDSQTSTLKNPGHTYEAAGTFTVTLTVSGSGGMDTLTCPNYIDIYAQEQYTVHLPLIRK